MTTATTVPALDGLGETANDRLKRRFSSWFWSSMIAATVIHFSAFALWPELTAQDFRFTSEELETIVLPPKIDIPPPPQQISRPATPVPTSADIDENITIDRTTFDDNPVPVLPLPPAEVATDVSAAPGFFPFTVAPSILNVAEVERTMVRQYPALLRDAGIGGTVMMYFFINEDGIVQDYRVDQTSGHRALDDAALAVADVFRFSPALNRDKRVPVGVSFPIVFRVNQLRSVRGSLGATRTLGS